MSQTRFQEVTAIHAPSAHIRFRERSGSRRAALILLLLVAATAATSPAQTFKTLYNFCSKVNCTDGGLPYEMALVQGANGDLYGTTGAYGANGYGTVFKITPAGTLTTIYNFCSQPSCADGGYSQGGLLLAADGSFYGVARQGGANGYGTVFKITAAGKLTTLYNFCSQPSCADGAYPEAGLIQATDGDFYGTTSYDGPYGGGTVFKIILSKKGATLKTLYSFCALKDCADGEDPQTALIQVADGSFYGTAFTGGDSTCYGAGTFFQMTAAGTLTPLSDFCWSTTGGYPDSALVQAANGNFYGTNANSAVGSGYGTFYEATPTGSITSLYTFCPQGAGCPDGAVPQGVILGTDGNFYGTTGEFGANNGEGTVFVITPTGRLTTLHTFSGADGGGPRGGLLLGTNGTFYGTTSAGGTHGDGVVFSVATGLGPFVETIPTSGAANTKVTILGTKLKGATAVSFNGTAATFKVVGSSEIKTTVPAGATSGTVTVTTSGGGTLNSNVAFQVR
jgi:uncharacterized repeat protein (TIGR03803 family)